MQSPDTAVVISDYRRARIRGSENSDVMVSEAEDGEIMIEQEASSIYMSEAEAEALFVVLDRMLHTEE